MLTKGDFGPAGSRHIVCLTDGGSVEEESLERGQSGNAAWFRYIVWNYRTPKARSTFNWLAILSRISTWLAFCP